MAVESVLEATSERLASPNNLAGSPVVALPPSFADADIGKMRVVVGAVTTGRYYDHTLEAYVPPFEPPPTPPGGGGYAGGYGGGY